ncbi:MAG: hypothetical protein ABIL02_06915, partial [candidate division WOR-3 bacterium]
GIWFMLDGAAHVSVAIYKGDILIKQLCQDSLMVFGGTRYFGMAKMLKGRWLYPVTIELFLER